MNSLQRVSCKEALNQLFWELCPVIPRESVIISTGTPYPKTSLRTSQKTLHIRRTEHLNLLWLINSKY